MSETRYRLLQPLLGFSKGEHLIYNHNWNEWTRQKTGETLTFRSSIGEGEKGILLNAIAEYELTTIMKPAPKPKGDK